MKTENLNTTAAPVAGASSAVATTPGEATIIPELGITFTQAAAQVQALVKEHNAIQGEDDASNTRRSELCDKWNQINSTILATSPQTMADAVVMLDRMLCPFTGIEVGTRGDEAQTITLVRDFMAKAQMVG